MRETDDHELLGEFARTRSESAFATLVTRYVNLVHSAAFRFTNNPDHSEEITQVVFIILARKAGKLSSRVVLSGWLYQVARLTAANFVKGEIRRQRRQQEAYMQSIAEETESSEWKTVAPLLDEAMGSLGETDRNAVVLRYFENKSAAEIGAALRMNEETARRRVNRAVEKLRKFFTRRNVALPGVILTAAISAHSVKAAPVALAKSVTVVAVAKSALVSTSTLTLIKGALKLMAWTKAKTAIVVSVAVILVVGTATTLTIQHQHRLKASLISAIQTDFPRSSWSFVGYATPEATAQSLFWALREGNSNAFQAYLNGFTSELRMKLESDTKSRGNNAFAELGAHELGGVTRYRILKKVTLSDNKAQLQIQFGGSKGPVQTLALEKIGNDWKCAGYAEN